MDRSASSAQLRDNSTSDDLPGTAGTLSSTAPLSSGTRQSTRLRSRASTDPAVEVPSLAMLGASPTPQVAPVAINAGRLHLRTPIVDVEPRGGLPKIFVSERQRLHLRTDDVTQPMDRASCPKIGVLTILQQPTGITSSMSVTSQIQLELQWFRSGSVHWRAVTSLVFPVAALSEISRFHNPCQLKLHFHIASSYATLTSTSDPVMLRGYIVEGSKACSHEALRAPIPRGNVWWDDSSSIARAHGESLERTSSKEVLKLWLEPGVTPKASARRPASASSAAAPAGEAASFATGKSGRRFSVQRADGDVAPMARLADLWQHAPEDLMERGVAALGQLTNLLPERDSGLYSLGLRADFYLMLRNMETQFRDFVTRNSHAAVATSTSRSEGDSPAKMPRMDTSARAAIDDEEEAHASRAIEHRGPASGDACTHPVTPADTGDFELLGDVEEEFWSQQVQSAFGRPEPRSDATRLPRQPLVVLVPSNGPGGFSRVHPSRSFSLGSVTTTREPVCDAAGLYVDFDAPSGEE